MSFDTQSASRRLAAPSFILFLILVGLALYAGLAVSPKWTVESIPLDTDVNDNGEVYYIFKGDPEIIKDAELLSETELNEVYLTEHYGADRSKDEDAPKMPDSTEVFVYEDLKVENVNEEGHATIVVERSYYKLQARRHWGWFSLLPALAAISLCWLTREPLVSLLGGVIVGAMLLAKYDLFTEVLVPSFASENSATILLLYLFLLGGLLGVWSRSGASLAFAEFMTRHFVRGPKTAKLVAWGLGVLFFQGGTVSTVLVGTAVKPISDRQRVSHEELSYIVDSTASPIASILAFNAWPGYVQAFIFVAGVPFLATEGDRIAFFFKSIPFSFYSIFAITLTLLLSFDILPFGGKKLKAAMKRARETGQLDGPDAEPLASKELEASNTPDGFTPHVGEFIIPLVLLIGVAIGTFIISGSPNVLWAFSIALITASVSAILRGMRLRDLTEGLGDGFRGVVGGAVILLLAIVIGGISRDSGGGIYLVELLGGSIPYWLLPVALQVLTLIIAFSTGTSWGTYAVAFPLAMPLAWAVATNGSGPVLEHPEMFMMICFAAVMNGAVAGDQCSPISDTTVLSSMCSGCDHMDHVRTQIPQASIAAILAGICWTAVAFFC
jgi:Na+/H+ antiporter NhaC